MLAYFDSSAFVKLLVEEDGSDLAAAIWDGCDAAVSSRLAYPEVRAALAAAGRAGRVAADDLRTAESVWERFWASTYAVELTEPVSRRAGQLTAELALGGADAVHLASALALGSDDLVVVAWDRRLADGVRAAGLSLAPAGPG